MVLYAEMSVLLYVHQKTEAVCARRLPVTRQGSTPPLTNFIIYPLCFTAYTFCDVTSQLSSLKGGGALDQKTQTYTIMMFYNMLFR